jgi:protein TonB
MTLTIWPPPSDMNTQLQSPSQPHEFPSDGEKQIQVGGGVHASKLRTAPPPVYPPLALQARIQGIVRFKVQIDKNGRVKRMQLVSGHPLLVESAKDALARYEYEPTLLNGEPVQVVTVADVNFSLNQ